MATFDQLSAEQRAIVELILKQGQSYDELAEMLAMPVARVKDLARNSLSTLSPVSSAEVDDEWRGQVADYLFNQQTGPEATATRGHLRRSEAARGWSRSVLDSLEQFYDRTNLPTIPEGEAVEPRRRERAERPERAQRELSPEAREVVRRRRLLGAGALALVALLAVLVWPIGVGPLALGGDDADEPESQQASAGAGADNTTAAAPNGETQIAGQLVLRPVDGEDGAGIAVLTEGNGPPQLIVQARLTPTEDRQAYEVWLYNSDSDACSLGAQLTDAKGTFQGAGTVPEDCEDLESYEFIDVSREPVDSESGHSGESVLRNRVANFAVPAEGQAGATPPAPPAQP